MILRLFVFKIVLILVTCFSISYAESGATGLVTNEFGYPITGVFVHACPEIKVEDSLRTSYQDRLVVETNSDGFYTIDLPAGYYSFYAAYESTRISSSDSIVFISNEYKRLDLFFDYNFELGSVSGQVTDQHGKPLHHAMVEAQMTGKRNQVNAEGRYTIANLPPGFNSFEVSYPELQSVIVDSVWIVPGQESLCNFNTISGNNLSDTACYIGGVVFTEDGEPAVLATVIVTDNPSIGAMTDSTGAYFIRIPTPGEYTLEARYIGCTPTLSSKFTAIPGEVLRYNFDSSTYVESDSTGGPLRVAPVSGVIIEVTDERGTNSTP